MPQSNLPSRRQTTQVSTDRDMLARELAPILKSFPIERFNQMGIGNLSVENIEDRLRVLLSHPMFSESEIQREINILPTIKKGIKAISDFEAVMKNNAGQVDHDDAKTIANEVEEIQDLVGQAIMGYEQGALSEDDKDTAEELLKERIDALAPVVEQWSRPLLGDNVVVENPRSPGLIGYGSQKNAEYLSLGMMIDYSSERIAFKAKENDNTWYIKEVFSSHDFPASIKDLSETAKASGVMNVVIAGQYDRVVFPRDGLKEVIGHADIDTNIALLRGLLRTAYKAPRWYEAANGVKFAFCL